MNDTHTSIVTLKNAVEAMVQEREWDDFHSLKNISMSISVEANELMELFLWCSTEESDALFQRHQQQVKNELADVLIAVVMFAAKANIDLTQAFTYKLEEIKAKYPIELSKGKSDKYTLYEQQKSMNKK